MVTAEDMVREKGGPIITVGPDTTIRQALKLMVNSKVGAVLISDGVQMLGIWTERDLMRNVLTDDFDPSEARIGAHMISPIRSAPHTDTAYNLMDKFLGLRLRHLPIEKDGEYVGLLSVGDVMRAILETKSQELDSLNAAASWEYYEEWHWDTLAKSHQASRWGRER